VAQASGLHAGNFRFANPKNFMKHHRFSIVCLNAILIGIAGTAPGLADVPNSARSGYAIVVRQEIAAKPEWKKVCDALVARHPGAEVVVWKKTMEEALPVLRKSHPKFTCFVAPCSEVGPEVVAEVHRLTRRYDDDVYTDTQWGISTGYDAAAALGLARFGGPIRVKRVAAGTQFAMEMVEEGIAYDELVANKVVKKPGGAEEPKQEQCPKDTTRLLADALTKWNADLFITSGHGFRQGWQIGFRYRNGKFVSKDGRLFGMPSNGKRFEIRSDHPRVYLPVGNCLIGCIDDKNAFAIAMMKSAGVKGMIGYTVPTWYGYAGWGCLDYFLEQPGRYTFNGAFLANQLALVHRLETAFPGAEKFNPKPGRRMRGGGPELTEAGRKMGVKPNDFSGLLHDRDTLAYYGDPALDARMALRPCAYDQKLEHKNGIYTLIVTGRRGDRSFAPVDTNGSQRGGRPILVFLPERLDPAKVELLEGADLSPVITDDFILVPNPGKGTGFKVKFRVKHEGEAKHGARCGE
jgi:zinc protease